MKKGWIIGVLLCVCLPATLFAQGTLPGGYTDLSEITQNVKVSPYAQAGFQWISSNLNLPVQNEPFPALPLQISEMDIALKDANFWAGTAGINVLAYEKYSIFVAAGGIIGRPFVTSGLVPVNIGGVGASPTIEFTNTKVENWFIQTGVGLGPVLIGLYWSHVGFALEDPRSESGPLANQTLRGDILTKTFAPFIGVAFPVAGAMLTFTYSPLAYSDTNLSLTSSQAGLSQLRYSWKKPGELINALLQYNVPFSQSFSFGVWGNYSWMKMRQGAELEFENTAPAISRSKEVTATMTQYVMGGGATLGVAF